jgi:hypothetical protein
VVERAERHEDAESEEPGLVEHRTGGSRQGAWRLVTVTAAATLALTAYAVVQLVA